MNILRPLSPNLNLTIFLKFLYSFLIFCTLLSFFCFFCLILGFTDFFHALSFKVTFSLGGRALYGFLIKMGLPGAGVLSFALACFVRVLLSDGTEVGATTMLHMQPADSAPSSGSGEWKKYLNYPSSSSSTHMADEGPSSSIQSVPQDEIGRAIESEVGTSAGASQAPIRDEGGTSGNGNPIAASPAHVNPYPYQPDEVIGGDSVLSIQRRLLAQYVYPSAEIIERARIEAEDIFEVKVDIIARMAPLDPEGDWLGRGARALDNPRTATGEESLDKLYRLRDDLAHGGIGSQSFWDLKGKVFLRRQNFDAESQA